MVKPIKIFLDDPYYYPGSTVKGSVLVSADKPKQYVDITISILGFSRVRWTESSVYKQYTTFQNTVRYIEQDCVLWSTEKSSTGYLQAGIHSFSFSFQLPFEAPPSFRSVAGKVIYQMQTTITQSSIFKFNLCSKVTLDVRSYIPRLCMQPNNEELDSSLTFCGCFNFGQIKINCSLPRSGYVAEEAIPLTLKVDNQSNKNIYIHASISRVIVFNSGIGRIETSSKINLSVSRSRSIPPGTLALVEIFLYIPPKWPVSITRCPIFSIGYSLVIQARSVLGCSKKMKIPIVIAHNVSTESGSPRLLIN